MKKPKSKKEQEKLAKKYLFNNAENDFKTIAGGEEVFFPAGQTNSKPLSQGAFWNLKAKRKIGWLEPRDEPYIIQEVITRKIITSEEPENKKVDPERTCQYCGKVCKSASGLRLHLRYCKENPDKKE